MDSPLTGVNTPGSDENRLKLYDLILGDDASKQGRIKTGDIIADEDIYPVPKLIIKTALRCKEVYGKHPPGD
ncbi:hypothetical protein Tco_1218780 [Tanacetum coccineum]